MSDGLSTLEAHVVGQVVPPDFDTLVANAARRRRRSFAVAGAGMAGVVGAAVIVGRVGFGADDGLTPPANTNERQVSTHTNATSPADLTPEQIVHDPRSTLDAMAVSPSDPDVRAAIWQLCPYGQCGPALQALAVTDDGFDTTSYVSLPGHAYAHLTSLRGDEFFLHAVDKITAIVDGSGAIRSVDVSGEAGPIGRSEVLIDGTWRPTIFYAINAHSGRAHRLSTPADARQVIEQPDGRLVAVGEQKQAWSVSTSADGGETWSDGAFDPAVGALVSPVQSADNDTMALVEGADGATLFPFIASWRSVDGGYTWQRYEPVIEGAGDDQAAISGQAVRPDGSLLVFVDGWSDATIRQPSVHLYGTYASDGTDWTHFSPLEPTLPPGADTGHWLAAAVWLRATTYDDGVQRLYIQTNGNNVFRTDDGGLTWTQWSAR
jgi:hypothetical protein